MNSVWRETRNVQEESKWAAGLQRKGIKIIRDETVFVEVGLGQFLGPEFFFAFRLSMNFWRAIACARIFFKSNTDLDCRKHLL